MVYTIIAQIPKLWGQAVFSGKVDEGQKTLFWEWEVKVLSIKY